MAAAIATAYLVRHLPTRYNRERRYSDATDPGLIDPPSETPLPVYMPAVKIIVSPAKRTRETARRWFPEVPTCVEPDLRELDFGLFSGYTADDLMSSTAYRDWVAGGCLGKTPGGEDPLAYAARVSAAYLRHLIDGAVYVTHAGPIMEVLFHFAGIPRFSLPVKTGGIVRLACDPENGAIRDCEVLA